MTIIRPNKGNKKLHNIIILFLGCFVVAFIVSGISMYGIVVGLHHDINKLQENLQKEELSKSKLQNQIFQITDVSNLERNAIQIGLIKEQNPQYLNTKSITESKITDKTAPTL